VVDLSPRTPLQGLLPVSIGTLTLSEKGTPHITAILPYEGKEETLATALKKAHDLSLPAVGRLTQKAGVRLVWSGRDQYLLIGNKPAARTLARSAALVDQSDGYAILKLEGAGMSDVMARLCPVDLRAAVFKNNHVAATELAHMPVLVIRIPKGVEILIGRSFGTTAVARLRDAMESVTAQQALTDVGSG